MRQKVFYGGRTTLSELYWPGHTSFPCSGVVLFQDGCRGHARDLLRLCAGYIVNLRYCRKTVRSQKICARGLFWSDWRAQLQTTDRRDKGGEECDSEAFEEVRLRCQWLIGGSTLLFLADVTLPFHDKCKCYARVCFRTCAGYIGHLLYCRNTTNGGKLLVLVCARTLRWPHYTSTLLPACSTTVAADMLVFVCARNLFKRGNSFQKSECMQAVPSGQDTERLVKVELMLKRKITVDVRNFQRMNLNWICNIVQLQFWTIEPNNRVAMFPSLHGYCTCDQLNCFVNYKTFIQLLTSCTNV